MIATVLRAVRGADEPLEPWNHRLRDPDLDSRLELGPEA